ncbi:hypothetical protein CLU79DRAFT_767091 [Phycomyces nitens]|nr:hypothetical protein CLU79DRAFT_767091 [Phycomyces nitens]
MFAQNLSFEIITLIAHFLSNKDRLTCATVCKRWTVPFQESLWNELDICDQKKLNAVYSICTGKDNVSKMNGRHVNRLGLDGNLSMSSKQMRVFQRCFPNLHQLNMGYINQNANKLETAIEWKKWGYLRKLEFCTDLTKLINPENPLLGILRHLNLLETLDLTHNDNSPSPLFTLKDFEALHRHLRKLKRLKLDVRLDHLSSQDISRIIKLSPQDGLKDLSLSAIIPDYRWLCYIAHTYPAIKYLSLQSNDNNEPENTYYQETVEMASKLPTAFQHLEKLVLKTSENTEHIQYIYWRAFNVFNIPLKHLVHRINSCIDRPGMMVELIDSCTRSCSETLQRLSIQGRLLFCSPNSIDNAFNCCPWLLDLDIGECNLAIPLDILLGRCVSLKRLRIHNARLSIKKKILRIYPHSLRIIELRNSSIDVLVFHYLSMRCNRLNYMYLTGISIDGFALQKTLKLKINMSFTHFELLILHNIRFYTLYGDASVDIGCNMMALSRPAGANQSPQNPKRPIMTHAFYKPIRPVESIWLHMFYGKNADKKWTYQTRVLKEKEVPASRKDGLFKTANINIPKIKRLQKFFKRKDKHKSEDEVIQPYAVLECGGVSEYKLGDQETDDYIYWQNLYNSLD